MALITKYSSGFNVVKKNIKNPCQSSLYLLKYLGVQKKRSAFYFVLKYGQSRLKEVPYNGKMRDLWQDGAFRHERKPLPYQKQKTMETQFANRACGRQWNSQKSYRLHQMPTFRQSPKNSLAGFSAISKIQAIQRGCHMAASFFRYQKQRLGNVSHLLGSELYIRN